MFIYIISLNMSIHHNNVFFKMLKSKIDFWLRSTKESLFCYHRFKSNIPFEAFIIAFSERYVSTSIFRHSKQTRRIEICQSQPTSVTFWTCGHLHKVTWHQHKYGTLSSNHFKRYVWNIACSACNTDSSNKQLKWVCFLKKCDDSDNLFNLFYGSTLIT